MSKDIDNQPNHRNPRSGANNPARGRIRRKWLRIAGGVVLVAVVTALMLRPAMIEVEVADVETGLVTVTVDEQGRTRARRPYTVAAPITGRLLRPTIDEGDRVVRGQVVARIAPPPTDARSEATARADLSAAQARQRTAAAARSEAASALRLAQAEAERRRELYRKRMISVETRDTFVQAAQAAEARLGSAEAALAAAQAETVAARARLLGVGAVADDEGVISVLAPVDGRVLHVLEESERVVQAGTPLFQFNEGDALELVIDVLTEQAVQVRSDDPIRITGWGGDTPLMGKVRYVEPGAFTKISALGVEEQRVNVIGDLEHAPPALGAQFRIEAAIQTWSGSVLRIPTGAMFRRDNAWQVFVIVDGHARLRKFGLGHRSAEFAEVTSGLREGEQVIVFPSDQIADGVRVSATKADQHE